MITPSAAAAASRLSPAVRAHAEGDAGETDREGRPEKAARSSIPRNEGSR